jgi:hypothetical protein
MTHASNRRSASALITLLLAGVCAGGVFSQSATGTINGRVTDPDGNTFSVAFVQATGGEKKTTINGAIGPDGTYSLKVPPGTYEISVTVPGMKPHQRPGVVVQANQTVAIDIRLEDSPSLRTLGEDPASIVATFINRPPPPKGRTPRMAGGKPDLSGMWLSGPVSLDALEMLPWAAALRKERADANSKDHPGAYCLPSGPVPLLGPGFFELVHHPKTLVMLFEGDTPGYRRVFLDGRTHPKNVEAPWLGYSTGRWEKDTLVVESIGFRDRGWLDFEGRPHSDKLRVMYRFSRPDLGQLNIEIMIDDPGALQKPWKVTKNATLAPDEQVREFICNENNKAPVLLRN